MARRGLAAFGLPCNAVTPEFARPYTATWIVLCAIAATMVWRARGKYALVGRRYFAFLAAPWKLATFVLATVFFVAAAPYTGDPTWDWIDGLFMSALTFWSAPWAVGALYRVARRELAWQQAYVAACVWLFSASWSYEAYLMLRDGHHPPTWDANLIASSVLYCAGGLLWNLTHVPGRGVIFAFMSPDWPVSTSGDRRPRIAAYAIVFVALVVAMMVPFVWNWLW